MKTFLQTILVWLIAISNNLYSQVNGAYDYKYDNLNRLTDVITSVSGYTTSTHYTYDDLGNRIAKVVTGVKIITKQFNQLVYCAGDSIQVVFTVGSDAVLFNGNIFIAQLSDKSGDFKLPTIIGKSPPSKSGGTILAKLPPEADYGTKYRIRVVSTDQQYDGVDNLQDLTINDLPATGIAGFTTRCLHSIATYLTVKIPGCTYKWTAEKGIKLTPDGRDSIQVQWDTAGIGLIKIEKTNTLTGCKGTYSLDVTVLALPVVEITGKDTTCTQNIYEYTSTTKSNMKFTWTPTLGTIEGKIDSSTVKIRWNSSGKGTIKLLLEDKLTGCINSKEDTVIINSSPTPIISGDSIVCNKSEQIYTSDSTFGVSNEWIVKGGKIIGSTPPYQIKVRWDTLSTKATISLIQTNSVTGCKGSVEKIITINPLPKPVIIGESIVCSKSQKVYRSNDTTSGVVNVWRIDGGGSILGETAGDSIAVLWDSVSSTGTIKLVQTNTNQCKDSTEKVITIKPLPKPVINGESIVCSKSQKVYRTNDATSGVVNVWSIDSGGRIIGSSVGDSITVLWDSLRRTGTIKLVQTNTNQCKDSTEKVITINPLPKPVIKGDTIVCAKSEEVYWAVDTTLGVLSSWQIVRGGRIIGESVGGRITVLWDSIITSGTIKLVQTNTNQCKDSTEKVITINPLPKPIISGESIVCSKSQKVYWANDTTLGVVNVWRIDGGGRILGDSVGGRITILWDSVITSGKIKLVQTNTNQCKDSTEKVITINPLPKPIINGETIVCSKSQKVYWSNDTTSGVVNVWSIDSGGRIIGASVGDSITVLWDSLRRTGTIKLMQTNTNQCKDSTEQVITINPLPKPVIKGDTIVCAKSEEVYRAVDTTLGVLSSWQIVRGGRIIGESVGGRITVLWDSISTSGTIKLVQTNTNQCKDSTEKVITINQFPKPIIIGESIVCSKSQKVYRSNDTTSGVVNVWRIDSGGRIIGESVGDSITVLWDSVRSTGTIKLVQTNTNQCKDSTEKVITIKPLPKPIINGETIVCSKSQKVYRTNDATSGVVNAWSIDSGGRIIGSSVGDSITVLWDSLRRTGTIKLVQTNTNQCKDSTEKVITINPLPNPIINGDTIVCEFKSSTYYNTLVSGISSKWIVTSGGEITTNNLKDTVSINWKKEGKDTLYLIQTNSFGCSDTTIKTINIKRQPIANISTITEVCEHNSYSYYAPPGYTYQWSINHGTQISDISQQMVTVRWGDAGKGSLKLIISASKECMDSIEKEIVINPLPKPIIVDDSMACAKSNHVYSSNSTPQNKNKWELIGDGYIIGSDSEKQVTVHWNSAKGALRLVQTNAITLCKDSIDKSIMIYPLPNPLIIGDLFACVNRDHIYKSNSTPDVKNDWSVMQGGDVVKSINENQVAIHWNSVGKGIIRLIQTNLIGCKDTVFDTVTIYPLPTPLIIEDTVACANRDHIYTTNSLPGIVNKWQVIKGGVVKSSNDKQVTIHWDSVNEGILKLTQTDPLTLCDSSVYDTITILTLPNTVINGDSIVCEFNSNIYSTNTIEGISSQWYISSGGKINGDNLKDTVTVDWNGEHTDTLFLIRSNSFGCSDTTIKIIHIRPQPVAKIDNIIPVCEQNIYSYSAQAGYNYKWKLVGGKFIGDSTIQTIKVEWGDSGNGSIKLIISASSKCIDSLESEVVINPLPKHRVINGDSVVCKNSICEYYFEIVNQKNTTSWAIYEGELISSTEDKFRVKWSSVGLKKIALFQSNEFGCIDSTILNINVLPIPKPEIHGDTSVCINNKYTYISNGDASVSNLWKVTGGVLSSTSAKETIVTWTDSVSGKLTLIQTSHESGCIDSVSLNVNIEELPKPTILGSKIVCDECQSEYISNSSLDLSNRWSVDGGSIIGTDSSSKITIKWNKGSTGILKLIQHNQNNCIDSVVFPVIITTQSVVFKAGYTDDDNIQVDFNTNEIGIYTLTLYSIIGEKVKEFSTGKLEDGIHSKFSTEGILSGQYILVLASIPLNLSATISVFK